MIAGIEAAHLGDLHQQVAQKGRPHPGTVRSLGLADQELTQPGNVSLLSGYSYFSSGFSIFFGDAKQDKRASEKISPFWGDIF